jgi:hypothetical protein
VLHRLRDIVESLLQSAEEALYAEKYVGRGPVICAPSPSLPTPFASM